MSAGLSVKEVNILTLKLMLQRRTGSHSVFFECEFEYERFTLAFSSHAPEAHKLKLKLTLFFCVCPPAQVQLFFEVLKYELL